MRFRPLNKKPKQTVLEDTTSICLHWSGLTPSKKEEIKKTALLSLVFGTTHDRRWQFVVEGKQTTLRHGKPPFTRGLCDEDICTLLSIKYSPPKEKSAMKSVSLLPKKSKANKPTKNKR